MYRSWALPHQQWIFPQQVGLASPPPAVAYVRHGGPYPPQRPLSELQMMDLLWRAVLRRGRGAPLVTAGAGLWDQRDPSPSAATTWDTLDPTTVLWERSDPGGAVWCCPDPARTVWKLVEPVWDSIESEGPVWGSREPQEAAPDRRECEGPPWVRKDLKGARWEQRESSPSTGSSYSCRPDSPPDSDRRQGTKRTCPEVASPGRSGRRKRNRPRPRESPSKIPAPLPLPDPISEEIMSVFQSCKQSDAVYESKLLLRDKVQNVLRELYQRCDLYIVGSSCTGFACDSSDVDICLFLTEQRIDQHQEAPRILSEVQDLLARDSDFRLELIRARVPILRFLSVSTGIQVDLNCNNVVGVRNTHLMQCYSKVDERVCPLIVIVKLWAQSHDINDACRQTLSSYSLVLMVIHFLQCGVRPPVLPNLQRLCRDKFRPGQPIRSVPKQDQVAGCSSRCAAPVGTLFLEFLRYYAFDFNFQTHVVSVRTASCLYKQQCRAVMAHNNAPGMWKYVCVEEPFDLTNTASAVHKYSAFERILSAFVESYRMLSAEGRLAAAFGPSGRPLFEPAAPL